MACPPTFEIFPLEISGPFAGQGELPHQAGLLERKKDGGSDELGLLKPG